MNKLEFVSYIASETKVPKSTVKKVVDATLVGIAKAMQEDEPVCFVNFGSFTIREKKQRNGTNPQTGEAITIPAKKVVGFKPSKHILEYKCF
jgi:DNA-binding protein HU-beta